ncbi:MAG: hypothetical protein GY870_12585 [archaeon]|nr:hypothetical protein [archaeon]
MNLKEDYDVDAKLKYRYLTPANQFEAALLVELSILYPNMFKLHIDHREHRFQEYQLQLKIINKKEVD